MFFPEKQGKPQKFPYSLITIFIFLIPVLLISTPATAEPAAQDSIDPSQLGILHLPENAGQFNFEGQSNKPFSASRSKLDADLTNLDQQILAGTIDTPHLRIDGDLVQVRVTATGDLEGEAAQAVLDAGGSVSYQSELEPVLQAWIPAAQLELVASDPAVALVSRPSTLFELDVEELAAQSEGLAAMNVQAWHNAGFRGQNIKVAVIDGGFLGYPSLLSGDLPSNVSIKNFVDGESDGQVNGTSVHGTACTEILADIAPDAHFYLLKINTDLDLEQAVNYAISQGVDVISTSVGWYNLTPGDGTGFFSNLVNKAQSNGIVWATAAGNDRQTHWDGLFVDADGDGFHEFAPGQEVNYFGPGNGNAYLINPGFALPVFVRWDDWTQVDQDFTLYVVRWSGSDWQIAGASNRFQNGGAGQTPAEAVIINSSGAAAPYGIVIERNSGTRSVNFEVFAPKMPRLDELVPERSLSNLADAPNAITMGAVNSSSTYALESYSGQGPTNGPGGSLASGFAKPDFTGYAQVSTESYGFKGFAGTSAAAPHAAGAAALVRSADLDCLPAQVKNILASRAVDQGVPGRDNIYGYGRLHMGNAPTPGSLCTNYSYYQPIIIK